MTLLEKLHEIRAFIAYDPSGRTPPLATEHLASALDSLLGVLEEMAQRLEKGA